MKDIEQAIADELKKQQKKPEDVQVLNLDSKCKSTHVKGLDAFTNLQSLSLCSLGLTSLEGFPALPKLTTLTLSDNRLTGGLQHLVSAGATGLCRLDLANNRIARLDELEPLRQLKHLSSLDLLDCPVDSRVPDLPTKLFAMLDELKYLNGADKEGVERDGDEEEDFEEEDDGDAGEEEYEEGAGAEEGQPGEEEEFEDEEGAEFEEGENDAPEYAPLVGQEPLEEDEEGDYEEEAEDVDEDEEDEAVVVAAPTSGGAKRKRADDDNAAADEEEEEDDEEDDDE